METNKTLNGLKQSGRKWTNRLHSHLCNDDFKQSDVDPCVVSKFTDLGKVIIIFWVDGIMVAASNEQLSNAVKMSLLSKFGMKDFEKLHWFLSIEFSRYDGCNTMPQTQYF